MKLLRLRARKVVDLTKKYCSNCQREYDQKENYNWSCRTHAGEYGGVMWWCCGKTKPTAIGCKVQKHITKDKEDEDEELDEKDARTVKCHSCKQMGHSQDECELDPNIRSLKNVETEFERLHKISQVKKLNSDQIMTTS